MSTLLSTLNADTFTILNEPASGGLYDSDLIDLWINNVQVQICDGQNLKFLRSSTSFLAPVKTTLSSSITAISTVISVSDTTNWDSSGAVWIDGDVCLYTGKTSTTLTGVTGITVNHASGAYVFPLKSLPTDYWTTPELRLKKNTTLILEPWIYYDELEWHNKTSHRSFTIVWSDNIGYLMIDGVTTSDVCVLYYQKYPTYMTASSDSATIPDPYARLIIPTLTASAVMLFLGDDLDGLGSKLKAIGEQNLFKMYKHYGSAEDSFRKIIKSDYHSKVPRAYGARHKTNYV